jgi:hypothetical protein
VAVVALPKARPPHHSRQVVVRKRHPAAKRVVSDPHLLRAIDRSFAAWEAAKLARALAATPSTAVWAAGTAESLPPGDSIPTIVVHPTSQPTPPAESRPDGAL